MKKIVLAVLFVCAMPQFMRAGWLTDKLPLPSKQGLWEELVNKDECRYYRAGMPVLAVVLGGTAGVAYFQKQQFLFALGASLSIISGGLATFDYFLLRGK